MSLASHRLDLLRQAAFRAPCSSRRAARKCKSPAEIPSGAFSSGDVLLSHGLSPYYHRGCSVSLPCSEWERVGPLRYCHQSAEPHWQFRCCRSDASTRPILWGRRPPYNFSPRSATAATTFSKEHDFQSAITNRKSAIFLVLWHLHTGSILRFSI